MEDCGTQINNEEIIDLFQYIGSENLYSENFFNFLNADLVQNFNARNQTRRSIHIEFTDRVYVPEPFMKDKVFPTDPDFNYSRIQKFQGQEDLFYQDDSFYLTKFF